MGGTQGQGRSWVTPSLQQVDLSFHLEGKMPGERVPTNNDSHEKEGSAEPSHSTDEHRTSHYVLQKPEDKYCTGPLPQVERPEIEEPAGCRLQQAVEAGVWRVGNFTRGR